MMILYTHVFHKLYLVKSNDFYFNSSKLRINFILPRLLSVTTNFNFSNLIKSYVGNSGVYMFINNKNPTYIYVGSSLNIGRRLNEYKSIRGAAYVLKTAQKTISSLNTENLFRNTWYIKTK